MSTSLRFVLAAIVGLSPAASLPSQLTGSYTIDPAGTGARNYKSFAEAITALVQNGMSGPVAFSVASGTYVEDISIAPFVGMSRVNTLTFKSAVKHGAVLQAKNVKETITTVFASPAHPVSGLVIDGFVFTGNGTAFMSSTPTTDVEIKDCHMQNDSNAIFSLPGSAPRSWKVHHNLFDGGRGYSILLSEAAGCEIHHNHMRLRGGGGVLLHTSSSFQDPPNLIYNNLLSGSASMGLHLLAGYDVRVAHNTFVLLSPLSGTSCIAMTGSLTRPNLVVSNIFVLQNAGTCVKVPWLSSTDYRLDGNIYYAPLTNSLVRVEGGAEYKSLPAWRSASGQDASSLHTDPLIVNRTTLPYDLHLQPTSPAIDRGVATPAYVVDDHDGYPREGIPDIGGLEVFNRFEVFGAGCAGTGGKTPAIGQTGSPRIGSTDFTVTLGNALGGGRMRAWFAIGASNKNWGPVALPFDFGGGCKLLVSADVLTSVGVSGLPGAGLGSAAVKIPVPNDPALDNVRVYFQWGVVDPAAAGIGVAFSDGAILRLKM